ncbi:MAG TPA: hypothetical protein VG758_11890 [Hyphomicrobiaceae bacterium]|jgi:hypothetical protein|nr:hypothetical protein [Hyphomicrobiaceae bacterium]
MTTVIARACLVLTLALGAGAIALAPTGVLAQQAPAKKAQTAKAGKGEKVCRVKLQYTGEVRTWVCPKEVPCCVWHEINYVKCGTTFTGCL